MKKTIQSPKAPAPIGPYSQAVLAGNTLYVSGQIAIEPATGKMIEGSIADEAQRVLENISAILEAAGMDKSHVVKCTIFLRNMDDFQQVNQVYARYFEGIDPPARETVEVSALPARANVEISCIAVRV